MLIALHKSGLKQMIKGTIFDADMSGTLVSILAVPI